MTFYAQSKPPEDAIAAALFTNSDYRNTFVDIGAYDGVTFSNTFHFYEREWKGINLEPHPDNYALLCQNQPHAVNLMFAAGATHEYESQIWTAPGKSVVTGYALPDWYVASEVPNGRAGLVPMTVNRITLTTVLEQARIETVDLLSLDVDGTELDVLRGLDLSRWRPRLMIIEFNHALAEMSAYLAIYGYRLARNNGLNAFYVQTAEDAKLIAGVR